MHLLVRARAAALLLLIVWLPGNAAPAAQTAPPEAQKAAGSYVRDHVLNCNGRTYFIYPGENGDEASEVRTQPDSAATKITYTLDSYQLDGAAKLNGFGYQGMAEVVGARYGRKVIKAGLTCVSTNWIELRDSAFWVRLQERNGRWQVLDPTALTPISVPHFNCAAIAACVGSK